MTYVESNSNGVFCLRSRYAVVFIAVLLLFATLTACSGNGQQASSEASTSEAAEESVGTSASSAASESESTPTIEVSEVQSLGSYSDGLAWVHYTTGSGADEAEWAGFVNDKGEVQFKYEFESKYKTRSGTPKFENGVVYIDFYEIEGNKEVPCCYAIDKNGELLGTFENVVAFGGGSVITCEYKDGFESTSYQYKILDNKENEVNSFDVKGNQSYDVNYCGEGVFAFTGTNMTDLLYFTKSNELIETDFDTRPEFDGLSDKALLSFDESEHASAITLVTTAGKTETIELGDLNGWIKEAWLDGDVCTLKVASLDQARMISYNVNSGESHDLDPKYVDAIDWYQGTQIRLADDRYAFMMQGADRGTYLGIFDAAWNPVVDPIKAESTSNLKFHDGRVLTHNSSNSHVDAYDTGGKLVFSLDSGGSVLGGNFSEKKISYAEAGKPYCYDIDGKPVFKEIVDHVEHDMFWVDSSEIRAKQIEDCYGMASSKFYSVADGSLYSETTYNRDNRGLVESRIDKNYKDGKESTTQSSYTYDNNGNESSRTVVKDGVTSKYTCTPQVDSNGKLSTVTVKDTDKGTVSTLEYEYYPDGSIKEYSQTQDGTTNLTQEFDKYGRLSVQKDPTYRNEMLSWELDDEGRPVSVSVVLYKGNDLVKINEFTFDTDDAGNITKEYIDGQLYAEFTYEKISNPADIARAWSQIVRPGL